MIIGLSGKMQSGKNTVASIIQYLIYQDKTENPSLSLNSFLNNTFIGDSYSGFIQKSFAHKLKKIVSILTGIPVGDLEKQEVKNRVLGEEWWYYKDKLTGSIYSYIGFADSYLDAYYLIKPTVRQKMVEIADDIRIKNPNAFINALFADCKQEIEKFFSKQSTFDSITKCYIINSSPMIPKKYWGKEIITNCFEWAEHKYPNWIISDLRFKNELQAVKERGGITIRVNRLNSTNQDGHTYINKKDRTHPSELALDNAEFDYVIDNNGTIEELVIKVKEILIKESIV